MRSETINIKELQKATSEKDIKYSITNLTDVFKDKGLGYLNEYALFITHFNSVPNFIPENQINCKKANPWFAEAYKAEIKNNYFDKWYNYKTKKTELDDVYYLLYDDLLVYFDINLSRVKFLFRKTNITKVEKVISDIKKFRAKSRRKPEINILVNTRNGIETKSMEITKPRLNIEDNYNDEFRDIHKTIMKRLSSKNDKGLILLHGKPGTGKTSYIRYLICSLKKNVIFLPPNMAEEITNPNLITILLENPNSIFVIEDAEKIVVDREKKGGSAVSAILNISDGLLSDCLNIQIICSFNIDISKIDTALMRKGRLIANYEFKELEVHKANALSEKLGYPSDINCPMTLTSIYNREEKDFEQNKKTSPIGFKANVAMEN